MIPRPSHTILAAAAFAALSLTACQKPAAPADNTATAPADNTPAANAPDNAPANAPANTATSG